MPKFYIDEQADLHAFADDGSEDAMINPSMRLATVEEISPAKSLKELAAAAMAAVNAAYVQHMGAIADAYPQSERESWPIQLAEAKDLLTVGETAVTPWVDQCAHQRGLERMELAQRIVAKDTAYRQVSGFFSGVRQWHEDCIDLLLADGEEARADLQAYNHLQGWVPAE